MSGDIMSFPATPMEFVQSYSFKDSREIYTNGTELVPVFRIEQMLEHYFPASCAHYDEEYDPKRILQALKLAYQILTDKRNSERYALSFLQSKSTGKCMYYGEMLDILDEIAEFLSAQGGNHDESGV